MNHPFKSLNKKIYNNVNKGIMDKPIIDEPISKYLLMGVLVSKIIQIRRFGGFHEK